MNKPYHIVVWDCLNEVFGIEWKFYYYIHSRWDYKSNYFNMKCVHDSFILTIDFDVYWESGKITVTDAKVLDSDIKWEWNDEDWFDFIDFDNLETFKQFLEYNKRRFYNE